jgi:hypothetical protein
MDPTIASGVIIGICTAIAPSLVYIIRKSGKSEIYEKIPEPRRLGIQGVWKGQASQEIKKGEWLNFIMQFNIRIKGRRILGEGTAEYKEPNILTDYLTIEGGFLDNHHLIMHYKNKDQRLIQFGTAVAQLSSECNNLTGLFVGYGQNMMGLVSGKFDLKKLP